MIDSEDIKGLIENARERGYEIDLRDIAYCILGREMGDKTLAYKAVFDLEAEQEDKDIYDSCPRIIHLEKDIKMLQSKKMARSTAEELTFEENRQQMVQLLKDIDEAIENEEIEKKDALKMKADIRTKLNDKFSVTAEEKQQQIVQVEPKFNFICPHTRRECYIATKEDLMRKYGLVEKKSVASTQSAPVNEVKEKAIPDMFESEDIDIEADAMFVRPTRSAAREPKTSTRKTTRTRRK